MLAFLALLGAPYIYDISSLRVNTCHKQSHTALLKLLQRMPATCPSVY